MSAPERPSGGAWIFHLPVCGFMCPDGDDRCRQGPCDRFRDARLQPPLDAGPAVCRHDDEVCVSLGGVQDDLSRCADGRAKRLAARLDPSVEAPPRSSSSFPLHAIRVGLNISSFAGAWHLVVLRLSKRPPGRIGRRLDCPSGPRPNAAGDRPALRGNVHGAAGGCAPGDDDGMEMAQPRSHRGQHGVAGGVTIGVVDLLEVVQVEHDNGKGPPVRRLRAASRSRCSSRARRLGSRMG
jgi:hypothetical protein